MTKLVFVIILISFCLGTFSLSIPDSKFTWTENELCLPKENCTEIFLKAQQDPLMHGLDSTVFNTFLINMVSDLNIYNQTNTILKLKILFPENGKLCVVKIGSKGLALSEENLARIIHRP